MHPFLGRRTMEGQRRKTHTKADVFVVGLWGSLGEASFGAFAAP